MVEGNGPSFLERDWLIVMWLDWGNLMVTTVASGSQTKLKNLLKNYQDIPRGLWKDELSRQSYKSSKIPTRSFRKPDPFHLP